MLLSQLFGKRVKERPADAFMDSHVFLIRGGYIRQVGNGIFTLLTPAKRMLRKLEEIIRQEMDEIGGQEVLFPVVLPAELWQESGRYDSVGSELVRFQDRAGRSLCLGMTHEEAAVHAARTEAKSYTDYPFMIYQIQTKFRDEPRSRGGLIRVREFTMKDGYSFHTSQEDLEQYYQQVHKAYHRIYRRVGLDGVLSVQSDSGMMGGKKAHEFMYLSEQGEDSLMICPHCGIRSNMEVADCRMTSIPVEETGIEKVATPGIKDIDALAAFLKTSPSRVMKASVFQQAESGRLLVVFIRGDYTVNEAKLRAVTGQEILPYQDDGSSGLCFGFLGPMGMPSDRLDILFDESLEGETNLACGANELDYHLTGVSMARDVKPVQYVNVYKVNDGDTCIVCGEALTLRRGIEVGNIFQLGSQYTKAMGMTYTDQDNQQKYPVMGCYGIGLGRLLACLAEEHHDEKGPIWPAAAAPWQIHICALTNGSPETEQAAKKLYEELNRHYETILDDRGVGAGIQFADADLLGVPVRVVVSPRNLKNGEAELSTRDKSVTLLVKLEDAAGEAARLLKEIQIKEKSN